jgi:hypothetical protein
VGLRGLNFNSEKLIFVSRFYGLSKSRNQRQGLQRKARSLSSLTKEGVSKARTWSEKPGSEAVKQVRNERSFTLSEGALIKT